MPKIKVAPEAHKLAAENVLDFILAGNCVITAKSMKTGDHYTYRIRSPRGTKPEDADIWFVGLLTGPRVFTYMGQIKAYQNEFKFWLGDKSTLNDKCPSVIAWKFIFNFFRARKEHPQLEIWHEGRCCRCGLPLTDPDSIEAGIGPICAGLTPRGRFK